MSSQAGVAIQFHIWQIPGPSGDGLSGSSHSMQHNQFPPSHPIGRSVPTAEMLRFEKVVAIRNMATDDGRSPEFAWFDLGGQPASLGVAYTDCEDC